MDLAQQIKAGMPVVCSSGNQFAVVDHMQGQACIKLKKGDGPTHHFIPLRWVQSCENGKVHCDRSKEQCLRDWSTTAEACA